MNNEQMQQELARLRAENLKLSQKGSAIKVSQKGAVSVYGFGQWPVTLYASQWETMFDKIPAIKQFIADHKAELSVKPAKQA